VLVLEYDVATALPNEFDDGSLLTDSMSCEPQPDANKCDCDQQCSEAELESETELSHTNCYAFVLTDLARMNSPTIPPSQATNRVKPVCPISTGVNPWIGCRTEGAPRKTAQPPEATGL
jgi:hypothetical protein